jgi:hypothetical protein
VSVFVYLCHVDVDRVACESESVYLIIVCMEPPRHTCHTTED